jgi:hypothetical protein
MCYRVLYFVPPSPLPVISLYTAFIFNLEPPKQVKKDRLEDNVAYDREYIAHYVEKSKNKRKQRRDNGGQLRSLRVSDDIEDLLGALETKNDGAAGGSVAAV